MRRLSRSRERRKNAIALILIAVFALAVFSINAVGEFMAEKVIAPLAHLSGGTVEKTLTEEITLGNVTFYLISCGSFPDAAQAKDARASCRERGGAGFLWEKDGAVVVADSCFLTKTDVREGTIVTLSCGAVKLRLTGKRAQIDVCRESMTALFDAVNAIVDTAGQLENGVVGAGRVSAVLQEREAILAARQSDLQQLASDHPVVRDARACIAAVLAALRDRPAAADEGFLPGIRRVACAVACAYAEFRSGMS